MLAVPGEIGVEDRVDRAGARHATFDRKVEMLDHRRSRAVGADHVPRPHGELPPVQPVAQRGGDAVGILLMPDVFGVERERGAFLGRLLEQDRLEQRLDDIHHAARACAKVVAPPVVAGSPRPHADQFGAGETGRERRVAHQLPWARVSRNILRDSEIAEDLVGTLVGDVRARAVGHPVAARHDVTAHAAIRQRKSRRRTGRAGPNDQHVCFVCHVCLRGCFRIRAGNRSVRDVRLPCGHHRHAGDPARNRFVEFLLHGEVAAR